MIRHFLLGLASVAFVIVPSIAPAQTAGITVSLAADQRSGQPVGTLIQWTVDASGANAATYRLRIARPGQPPDVLVDYRPYNVFSWVPLQEGRYEVEASARDSVTGETAQAVASFDVVPPSGRLPVVTPTSHPLIAFYSAPPCPAGLRMRIRFMPDTGRPSSATHALPCDDVSTMSYYVAGLRQNTRYSFFMELLTEAGEPAAGGGVDQNLELTLQTGAIDRSLVPLQVLQYPGPGSSFTETTLLLSPSIATVLAGGNGIPEPASPMATDLWGFVTWYYPGNRNERPSLIRPVPGGTLLLTLAPGDAEGEVLRQIDLAGRVLRETNRRRVSDQLVAMGQDPITAFHHDAQPLPGGYTAVIASAERILAGVQGAAPVDILGDMIVVLDPEWQVTWVWNPFDHLDVTRRAVLAETCTRGQPGCPPFFQADIVNDWTHTNAITRTSDGNLLLSVRNQDWIVKINFGQGQGTGEVMWRLGPEGDFAIDSSDPWPWFSHQHDPRFASASQLVVYDNGNTRCVRYYDLCYSRGQVYQIDEAARVVRLALNADLGKYAPALGSSQPLANGNFHFNSGTHQGPEHSVGTSDEVAPDGGFRFSLRSDGTIYRSWRLTDLYMSGQ